MGRFIFATYMRAWLSIVGLALALSGGGRDSDASPASFATDQRIVYSDRLHNENTTPPTICVALTRQK